MKIILADYIDVQKKLKKFELNDINSITLLPFNFENSLSKVELVYEDSVKTVRTLFRNANLPDERIEKLGDLIGYRSLNGADTFLLPIIFLTSAYISQDSTAINLALSVIANYLTDVFKGVGGNKEFKLEIITEKTEKRSTTKITFIGNSEEFKSVGIDQILKSIK